LAPADSYKSANDWMASALVEACSSLTILDSRTDSFCGASLTAVSVSISTWHNLACISYDTLLSIHSYTKLYMKRMKKTYAHKDGCIMKDKDSDAVAAEIQSFETS
jgi:hypothetical protein